MDRAWAFVGVTLIGTVTGQMLLKYAVERRGPIPAGTGPAASYLGRALLDPLVLLSLTFAFLAAVAWIGAVSRLPLSQAYPFMALAFIVTTVLSAIVLGERVSALRWAGSAVVVFGLVLVARS
jgi:drug/metabolite transporter (DMT)-like permease